MIKILKSIPIIGLLVSLGCSSKTPAEITSLNQGDYNQLKEDMRQFIQKEMDEKNIVGLSIALVDDQQIVWQEGFGYRDKKQKIKATPASKYSAGSITKLFNALGKFKPIASFNCTWFIPSNVYSIGSSIVRIFLVCLFR